MKGIVTSDWHIGVKSHAITDAATGLSSRLLDVELSANNIVDYAINNDAEFFWFLGDLFHTNRPTPTEWAVAVSIFDRLESAHIPTLIFDGNHDFVSGKGKISAATALQYFRTWGCIEFYERTATRKWGDLTTIVVPHGCDLQPITERTNNRQVLLCHTTFDGATVGSEGYMMASHVRPMLKGQHVDLILSGHHHKPQRLVCAYDRRVDVIYPGSIEKVNFGERDEQKEFGWFDTETLEYRSIGLETRPMIQIDSQARTLDELQAEIAGIDFDEALVKVTTLPRTLNKEDVIDMIRQYNIHNVTVLSRNDKGLLIAQAAVRKQNDAEIVQEIVAAELDDPADQNRAMQLVQEVWSGE